MENLNKKSILQKRGTIFQNEHHFKKEQKDEILIYVSEPVVVEGVMRYVQYKLTGELIKEPIYRRFSDFYSLREKLVERWPGLYIPNLPPKKTVGNLEKEVIEMRTRVINDFCHKTSKFKYLLDCEEFQLFLMKSIDVSKVINKLPKLSYEEILYRYKNSFDANSKFLNYKEGLKTIDNSLHFIKKVIINLRKFQESIERTMEMKDKEINYYINLLNIFQDYEKTTLMGFAENDETKLVFFNSENTETFKKIYELKTKTINPFKQLLIYVEDDILDFEAMLFALESINNLSDVLDKLNERQIGIENEIKNYENNNISFLNYIFSFKSTEKYLDELYKNKQENLDDAINLESILEIVTYVTLNNLEIFKTEKLERYHKHLKLFAEEQKSSIDIKTDLWNYISKDKKIQTSDSGTDIKNS